MKEELKLESKSDKPKYDLTTIDEQIAAKKITPRVKKELPAITTLVQRALDCCFLGYNDQKCADIATLPLADFQKIRRSREGIAYIKQIKDLIESDINPEKRKLIIELYARLSNAKNQELVALIYQISKMLNFEAPEFGNQINFVWDNDPFNKKPSVIDKIEAK